MSTLPATPQKKNRDIMHVIIAVIIGLIIGVVIPEGNGITQQGLTILALFVPTLYLWLAVAPTTWVSILFLAAFAMTGIRTPAALWQQSVGSFTFTLVMAFMIFDHCLKETGVVRRLADWFITRKFTQGRPYLFLAMFFASNLIIGIFMQNLALAIIFVALTKRICDSIGVQKGDSLYTLMFVGVVWGNAVNHVASPIGKSIPNIVIGLAYTNFGIRISFAHWLIIGIPFLILMLVVTMVVVRIFKPDVTALKNFDLENFRKDVKPLGNRGKIALGALAVIFIIIMVPETLAVMGYRPAIVDFTIRMTITTWILLIVALLSFIRAKDKGSSESQPVLIFKDAVKEVDVGILLFIAALLFVGGPLGHADAGFVAWLGNIFGPVVEALPLILVFAILSLIALVLTQFMASTLVATIVFFIGLAVFATAAVSPAEGVAPFGEFVSSTSLAWVVIGTMAACIGISIPASTATTPLYYGPHIEVKPVVRVNIIFILLTLVAVMAVVPIALAIFRTVV